MLNLDLKNMNAVDVLLMRWRMMARARRQEAKTLRSRPGAPFVSIACHEARADAFERLIAELETAVDGAAIPAPGEDWAKAEARQIENHSYGL